MRELINKLNEATKAYDKGCPIMTDEEWDDLYFELKKEEENGVIYPDSPTQTINYQVVNGLVKKKHNHPMLSLDKTKDWNEFLRYFDNTKDVIGMLKLDGLTCSLRYLNGELVGAETRGNGAEGEDILHNASVVKSIPKHIGYTEDELVIDGEIICTFDNFSKFTNEYSNPRNFAAGSIRLLDNKECEKRNLTFVAWNVVKGFSFTNSLIEKFNYLQNNGFTVVPWTSSFDLGAKEFLIKIAKEHGYPIDGLVGRYDDIKYGQSLGATSHHIKAAYAFKFYDEEYITKLLNIEWTMGRLGTLTPVALFEPIEIDGAIIERASLHNLNIMSDLFGEQGPKLYQTISIYRANEIIPQVSSVNRDSGEDTIEIIDHCPYCGELVYQTPGDATLELVCRNPECEGQLINRLDHMLGKKGLNAKGISKATLEKLIEWGWVETPVDLFELAEHRAEWIRKPGFGPKSVDKVLEAIDTATHTTLEAFIASIGIPLIGHNVSKELVKHINSYEELRELVHSGFDFSQIYGFGLSKTNALLRFDYTYADEIYNKYITIVSEEPIDVSNELEGLSVAITGKLIKFKNRAELEEAITLRGGKISKSITGKTNILITNDATSGSAKNREAQAKGIPILTEEEFIQKYLE